jgi:hypothetical protein
VWALPQAVVWDTNLQEIEVALYVRALKVAEANGASVAARNLVRQLMDGLGLTTAGLLRNRWIITAESEPRPKHDPGDAPSSIKDRLKVVEGRAVG